ncbi:hypothetical protein [Tropicibacter alexandrii]|uniref:hypothetical protein n=1 Tax=Tropicibacter alexandrii TaxID=2267683 RepID=UPI0013E8E1DA|nr:hypothetical protein [Tropicibacter alexandrii]
MFLTLSLASVAGAEGLRIDATGQESYAGAQAVGPIAGEVETRFGGYVQRLPLPGIAPDRRHVFLDPDGGVATVGETVLTARDLGQVGGHAWLDGDLYLAASASRGLHLVGPDRDGDGLPDRLLRGAPGAMWMPGQWGPHVDAGPGSIWKIDGATGEISHFALLDVGAAGLGAVRVEDGVLVVQDLHRDAEVRIDPTGQVLDAPEGPLPLRRTEPALETAGGPGRMLDAPLMTDRLTLRCGALDRPGHEGANARCVTWVSGTATLSPVAGDVTRVAYETDPGVSCYATQGVLLCRGQGRVVEHLSAPLPFVTCADRLCQTVGGDADLEIIQRADWGRGGTCSRTEPCVFTYEVRNAGPEAFVGPVTLRARMRLDQVPVAGRFDGIAPAICDPADLTGSGCTAELRLAAGETRWFAVRYVPPEGRTGYLMNCVELYDPSLQPGADPDGMDWQSSCADIAVVEPALRPEAEGPMPVEVRRLGCDTTCRFEIELSQSDGPVALDVGFAQPVAGEVTGEGMDCLRGDALGLPCIIPETSGATRAVLHLPHEPYGVTQTVCVRAGVRGFAVQRAQVVQALLNARGIDAGPVDGLPGSKTRKAIEALHEELDLPKANGLDDAIAALSLPLGPQSCATARLPAAPAPCLPWEQRDETGACRTPGTSCAPGQTRDAKGDCITPAAACPPWQEQVNGTCQPAPLRCDFRTTWLQKGCPCRFPTMTQAAPGRCTCPKDTALIPGQGCKPLP